MSSAASKAGSIVTLAISNVQLSGDGVVYFVLETELVVVSSTDKEVSIRIRESLLPSA
jgi:hypothetical protein